MRQYSVYRLARALYEDHGWEPDAAVSAAHCYVNGKFPTATWPQAIARMESVKRWPKLTAEQADQVQAAYRRMKVGGEDELYLADALRIHANATDALTACETNQQGCMMLSVYANHKDAVIFLPIGEVRQLYRWLGKHLAKYENVASWPSPEELARKEYYGSAVVGESPTESAG